MAFEVFQLSPVEEHIGHDSQSAELHFFGRGSFDQDIARAAFFAFVPAIYEGLLLKNLDNVHVGGGCWTADVSYEPFPSLEQSGQDGTPPTSQPPTPSTTDALGPEYSIDISVVQEHITQSKQTISKTKLGAGVAADNKQAIGITRDGEVKGCDRQSPHLEWSTTRVLAFLTFGYINTLYKTVGKTNNAMFFNFAIGEVLMIGVSAQSRDVSKYSVTYKFACQPNELNIQICPGLIVPAKKGFEYLWVSYRDVIDANQLTMTPEAAYVERIYDSADYSLLGIGG
jgi:hypothetical protein